MISESTEETASLYVLGLLDADEAARFAAEIRQDEELARLVFELEASAATLAHAAPMLTPPSALKVRIIEQIGQGKIISFARPSAWLPWAVAACLAIAAGMLAWHNSQLQTQLVFLRSQDSLSRLKIATLGSMLDIAPRGLAVVVWDREKQRGYLKVENMPVPRADQDYQLWVIDPGHKLPVNAGVFRFEPNGIAAVSFQPDQLIASADKFAISLERKGGAPQHEGPIVMISK